MTSIGPLPMSIALLAIALLIAMFTARSVARRMPMEMSAHMPSVFINMLLVSLFAGRLVFVLQWLPLYLADPWSIIRAGDGGYTIWAAIGAGIVFLIWQVRRNPLLRRPLAWGALAGIASWTLLAGTLVLLQRATISLPETQFARLDGGAAVLSDMKGEPMVVNLWATWCPPCQREMPILADAQRAHPEVTFVFVNQGEGRDDIRRYLQAATLELNNVLLDPFSTVSQSSGTRGLPTTLFFDGQGRLVDTHVGELTSASLARKLQQHAPAPDAAVARP